MAHAAGDAHEFPIYGAHFRVTFPILDADGDLVSGAASLDSEVSKDSGTLADCTNEATEIATSSGMYYLDLTGAEMEAKKLVVIVKTSTAGAKTTPITLYPRRMHVMETGTAQAGAAGTITLASGASADDDFYNGLYVVITNNSPAGVDNQARRIIDYVGSTKVATLDSNWGTNPSSATTYEIQVENKVDVAMWAGAKVVDVTTPGTPHMNLVEWLGAAPLGLVSSRVDASVGAMAAAVLTATAIATDALTAAKAATDLINEIRDSILSDGTTFPGASITEARLSELDAGTAGKMAQEVDRVKEASLIRRNTAQAGAASTITLDSGALAVDDIYNELWIVLVGGTGAGQARVITDYVGATKVATIAPNWVTNPDATSVFAVLPAARSDSITAGSTDWTAAEKNQIRDSLGLDGTKTAATGGQLQTVRTKTDQLAFTIANKVDSSIQAAGDFAQAAADKVWSSATRTLTAFSTALALSVWDVLESAIVTASSIGLKVKNNLDAAITSRSSHSAADVWASGTRTLTAFSTTLALSVWNVLESAIATASSIGLKLKNNVDAAVTTRATPAQVGTELDNRNLNDLVQITGSVSDATPAAGNFDGNAGLSATDDFYNGMVLVFTGGTLAGISRRINDYNGTTKNIVLENSFPVAPADTDAFSIIGIEVMPAAPAGTTDWTSGEKENIRDALGVTGTKTAATGGQLQTVRTKTDQLAFTIANKVDSSIQAAGDFAQAAADKVWSSAARTLTSFGTLVSDIWASGTRTLTGFSTALALSVWNVLESAIVTASSIGLKVKNNLNATVSSRSTFNSSSDNVTVGAVVTDAINAASLAADAANEIADALLKRDIDQVEASAALHSLGTAVLKSVSRIRNNAGTLEVFRTDGTTVHMKQTVTTDATNEPVDELTGGVPGP